MDKIDKIIELQIDVDGIDFDDTGVSVVSFVEEPAIEMNWMAFNKEQFVTPNTGEDEAQFIGRCMSALDSEFPDESQRLAVCYSYWDNSQFNLDDACWEGYEAIGLKPGPGGTEVPNCVPIENQKFESYKDYPESAKTAAKRALDWRDSHPDQDCGTRVGWARANQLAKGESISENTIARMASFARHLQYKDVPYSEGCGGLMVDAWGGQAGIEWAQTKLKTIRDGMSDEQRMVLDWARDNGESITEDFVHVDLNTDVFNSVTSIKDAIIGLDILGKMGIKKREDAQVRYQYTGPSAERGFCRAMMGLNKMYSAENMQELEGKLSSVNPGMGPGGRNRYSVFRWKGGVNCRHFWSRLLLYKPEGSNRVLMINEGPAQGDAGKSNNRNEPSPTGATSNNASLRFSTVDEDQRIVAGPLMVANKMIFRRDEDGTPYYVYFSPSTIKKIQEKWSKTSVHNQTDVEHNGEVTQQNTLLEQWIVESPEFDKSRYYGFGPLPKGTWFGVYKVNDEETWKAIKKGDLKGFSIEGNFVEKAQRVEQTPEDAQLTKILDIIRETK